MESTQGIESSLDEWISNLQLNSWCWFESDKPKPSLWNHTTNTTSSLDNMLIRAAKAGINKESAKAALERQLPMISGTRFTPSLPNVITQNGCNFVNTFKTYLGSSLLEPCDPLQDDFGLYLPEDTELHKYSVEPFTELLERLTSNAEDSKWLMCWLAHMIQKPEERPSVHPLFRTEHGIGKNVLVEQVMNKLLCKQTVTTSLREIRGSHSESSANNLLVFVDESKAKGMNVYLELKSLLTTNEILVNPKHIRPYKQQIFSRFMFADNTQGRAFNIEQEDRRIYVMEYVIHEYDKEETQLFIAGFLEWFSVHWQLVYGYLLHYDISDWSPHNCPLTEAKKSYLGMCEDPVDSLLQEYIAAGYQTLDSHRWDGLVISHGLNEYYSWSKITCTDSFKYQLENAGFVKLRVGRTRATGYFLNGLEGQRAFDVLIAERDKIDNDGVGGRGVSAEAVGYSV